MKIQTKILQEMIAKAIKGASNNTMIPITSLIGVELKNNILTLMTTDGSNHLQISQDLENEIQDAGQEFYTVVNAEIFSKLVAKTTTDVIYLTILENCLEFKGNGTYKLDIAVNEDGVVINFPRVDSTNYEVVATLDSNTFRNYLNKCKDALAKTMEIPCLTGYYIGENIIATDRDIISAISESVLSKPLLINNNMGELIQLIDGQFDVYTLDNNIAILSKTVKIYGKQLEGIEIYPVQALQQLLSTDYLCHTSVNKQELLNVLDRMSLFITEYDKNGVYLIFTNNVLQVVSQKSSAAEIITLNGTVMPETLQEYRCLVDVDMLKSQVQTNSTDCVDIFFGQPTSIKIVDGNTTNIISLLDNSELNN